MDMTNQPNKATVKDGLPTAEEILRKHFLCDPNNEPLDEVYVGETTAIYSAMREYADQQNAELMERVKELEGLMQEFVDRVDRGEIRSKRTYAKFKEALKK